MEYVNKFESYPNDFFSNSFKDTIAKTKVLFENHKEFIEKPMVKCCILGNTSTGKSTLLNVLLEKDMLHEGIPVGTICAAICQSSSNNEEYFKLHEGNVCLDKKMNINSIKNINRSNAMHSKFSMSTKNHLDIYLNLSNHEILHNFLLIDCPGYNVDNLEEISKYCDNADIIVFCFRAKDGITDRDIDKINRIKSKIGKFQINFIINCCDELDLIDIRDGIIKKLSPHLTGEDAIYFISAREEKIRMFHDATRQEFKRLKECLQKQNSLEAAANNNIYLALICSINNLLNCMRFTNYQEFRFIDTTFRELQQTRTSYIDKTKPGENESDETFADSSDIVNKETTDFIIRQFINDYNLNDGNIDENCSSQLSTDKDPNKLRSSWLEFDENSEEMKLCVLLSALEEKVRMLNDERHREFEKFKQCLQKQKSKALFTYNIVYLDLIVSINKLLDCMNFTNFREYQFSDVTYRDIRQETKRLIDIDKNKYCKDEVNRAFTDYSAIANKTLTHFIKKQFSSDHNLNDDIINENYFYKSFNEEDAAEPTFSRFEFGDKSSIMKPCFLKHFKVQLNNIRSDIERFYRERTQTYLNELKTYKNELIIIRNNINKLAFLELYQEF